MTSLNINLNKIAKDVTVRVAVKGLRTFKIRMWFAVLFIQFGVWLAGMSCKIEEEK